MIHRLGGLVLLIWASLLGGARARELELDLSRLSTGDCAGTVGPGPLVLADEAGPALRPDQQAFRVLVSQLSELSAPTSLSPVTTTGPAGFEVALETVMSTLASSSALERGFRGTAQTPATCDGRYRGVPSQLFGNRLRFTKGLPFGATVGATAGMVHQTGLYLLGFEGQLALLEEVLDGYVPDLALRASITRVLGARELTMFSAAFDLVLSKRFVVGRRYELSPFLGLGLRWTRASARSDLTPNVDAYACAQGRDAVCNAAGLGASTDDLAHDVRFGRISQLRSRAHAGLRLRVARFAITGAFALDVAEPRTGERGQGPTAARQYTVSLAPGVVF